MSKIVVAHLIEQKRAALTVDMQFKDVRTGIVTGNIELPTGPDELLTAYVRVKNALLLFERAGNNLAVRINDQARAF